LGSGGFWIRSASSGGSSSFLGFFSGAGGCFSSGAEKANAHYRGSLEPGGFWRGNGFRVVVV